MKELFVAFLLMGVIGMNLCGCADETQPVAPKNSSATSAGNISIAKSGVLMSATGSCQTYLIFTEEGFLLPGPKGEGSLYNTMSFSAIKHGDGSYSGMFLSQMHRGPEGEAFLQKVKGKVIHLSVQGDIAKIIFEITQGDLTGQWGVIAFKDVGEGGPSAPPDLQAAWWWSDIPADLAMWEAQTPQEYIDWTVLQLQPYLPWFTGWFGIDNGNVQVR